MYNYNEPIVVVGKTYTDLYCSSKWVLKNISSIWNSKCLNSGVTKNQSENVITGKTHLL